MRFYLILILVILFNGCIKQAKLDYRQQQPLLVVEGLLLTDSTPCKVTLSYSGLFNENGAQLQSFIDDAVVYLKDDDSNDSTKLINQQSGTYVSSDGVVAKAGGTYHITITLSNSEKYASFPEKIVPVQKDFEIDSIGVGVSPGPYDLYGADVKIRTQDPANETNYYRWTSREYIPRKATGVPCGFPPTPPCFQYCYQYFEEPVIHILSDVNINGNEIRHQSVLISPYYYYGAHYIEIKQLSLTRQAYEFWKFYLEQSTRTGTILDPLPSPLQGNIYNTNNPDKLALGYFEASDVASKKIILAPIFLNAYLTLQYYTRHEAEGACYQVYPNAQSDAPSGWENIPETIYNVY